VACSSGVMASLVVVVMVQFGCGTVSIDHSQHSSLLTACYEVRTGQAHRTLLGHTAPVSCLQFDEIHIASGSLDKTIRVSGCLFLFCS
jgi:hypothetical protein